MNRMTLDGRSPAGPETLYQEGRGRVAWLLSRGGYPAGAFRCKKPGARVASVVRTSTLSYQRA